MRGDVLAGLLVTDVLDHFGVAGKRGLTEFRTKICPACGPHTSDWTTINLATGVWCHHGARCRGDILALVAGYAGLDVRAQFPKVLDLAAEIAGIVDLPPTARAEADRRRAVRRAALESEAAEVAERRRSAQARAATAWERAARRSPRGEAYINRRGLSASELILRGVLRFDGDGNPMVALYDNTTGEVVNTASRIINATGDDKVLVRRDCTTVGTMVGRIADLSPIADEAFLVEGVTDGLAATLTCPGVVLAAHCAGQFAAVAAAAARMLRTFRGRLYVVPDRGVAGERAGDAALDAAEAAGMKLDRDLHLVDLGAHDDLAAAVKAGWQWSGS